jgi:hypothetical protein
MLGVELVDAVSLERVIEGVAVTAKGLIGKPIVNQSGLFVWLKQDIAKFDRLIVEPGARPFQRVEVPAAQVQRPIHTVELLPLASYPFTPGTTALRGSLIETSPPAGVAPKAVAGATIRLEWLDDDAVTWGPSGRTTVTNASGDFTLALRLTSAEVPRLDTNGLMSIRLYAKRAAGPEKHTEFKLPEGRVADRTYAWDQLQ